MVTAMSEYAADIPVLDHLLHMRKAFANVASSGRSVVELKLKAHEKQAKDEIEKLISIVFKY